MQDNPLYITAFVVSPLFSSHSSPFHSSRIVSHHFLIPTDWRVNVCRECDEYFVLKEAEGEIRCKIPCKNGKVVLVLN
jgi:hypothetical protein